MNYWISSSLILGSSLLLACSHNTNNQLVAKTNAPHLQAQAQVEKTVREITLAPPKYKAGAPDRYVVKRGDTLWIIATKFLENPGRWKEIWHANPHIKNPNRIYPGDVISYHSVGGVKKLQVAGSSNPIRGKFTGRKTADGRPIYNVTPEIREEYLTQPIPTVPKEVVFQFMTKNLILEPGFSSEYPYVVGQSDGGYIALTGRDKIYAKTDDSFEHNLYSVYREANPVQDPVSGELLGVEATYVGQLKLTADANDDGVGTFAQTDSVNPLYPNDILMPAENVEIGIELNFMPQLPNVDDEAAIVIRSLGQSNTYTGVQFSTLLVNLGAEDGISLGDVFKIVRAKEQKAVGRDGQAFSLPDYEVGMGMIYKTYDNTSYLLVMSATDVIYPGDRLLRP